MLLRRAELLPWIDEARLVAGYLARNPSSGAVRIIRERLAADPGLYDDLAGVAGVAGVASIWAGLSTNAHPDALTLLAEHPNNVVGWFFSNNASPEAVALMLAHPTIIDIEIACYNTNPAMIAHVVSRATPSENFDCWGLSANPAPEAMAFLANNPDMIDWTTLSDNASPGAAALLVANPDRANWYNLARNPAPEVVEMLLAELQKTRDADSRRISPGWLSANPSPMAIAIAAARSDDISWTCMSRNPAPEAIELLAANVDKIDWMSLLYNTNPAALDILAASPENVYKICEHSARIRERLASVATPAIIELLTSRPDVVDIHWGGLSCNPCREALALLATNPGRIDWIELSRNPGIFEDTAYAYDYTAMRAAMDVHREELAKVAGHPRRLARHLALGGDIDDF